MDKIMIAFGATVMVSTDHLVGYLMDGQAQISAGSLNQFFDIDTEFLA